MANAPPYHLYPVVAARVEMPTPRLKRITLDARPIPGIRADLPAQWLKVFVPTTASRRSGGRAYTIRRYDPSSGLLDLDFVLHGDDGAVAAWAARVEAGAAFEVSHPHPRSGCAIDPETSDYVLIGDETGLPGIAAILEALPAKARATVVVEIAGAGERQELRSNAAQTVTWLHRDPTRSLSLRDAVRSISVPPHAAIWVAAESSEVSAIRKDLKARGVADTRLHASGYWKRGEANHRDPGGSPE